MATAASGFEASYGHHAEPSAPPCSPQDRAVAGAVQYRRSSHHRGHRRSRKNARDDLTSSRSAPEGAVGAASAPLCPPRERAAVGAVPSHHLPPRVASLPTDEHASRPDVLAFGSYGRRGGCLCLVVPSAGPTRRGSGTEWQRPPHRRRAALPMTLDDQ
ncbi:unnamed protein product [Ectocarpus sp. 6 AP-2014]